jgi:hypothetical protein
MNKGSIKTKFLGQTTHRIPKVATLALSTCVLVTMIALDASASPNGNATLISGPTNSSIFATESSLNQLFSLGHRHPQKPTKPITTTGQAPTTTTTSPAAPVAAAAPVGGGGGGGGGGGASAPTTTTTSPAPTTTTTNPPSTPAEPTAFPVGTADSSQPSGFDAPSASALAGYTQSYVTDFPGTSLPAGWQSYSGKPSGDPGGQFGSAHAVVSNGMLSLNTFQDPAYGNEWVTGGVCDCGHTLTYGAYFVRSRVTGAGPTNVELLWPASNNWPPEIDFNETLGSSTATTATVHWGSSNSQYHSNLSNIDMTQWHTWGVIWTPSSITYTVDGRVWATVSGSSAQIPDVPMTLDLQQQTWCGASPAYACPSAPESMQINWVAEYTPNS